MMANADKKLIEQMESRGFFAELGMNRYYREWCFMVDPKPKFRAWVIQRIKDMTVKDNLTKQSK